MLMMLKSITVYKLYNEYTYEIQLSDDDITFIHSQNGVGKSTLMRLVAHVLKGDEKEMLSSFFERLDLGFDDGSCLIVEKDNNDLLIQMQKNEVEEEITLDELRKILPCTYIPPERITIITDGTLQPALQVYYREFAELFRSATDNNKLVTPPKEGRKELSDAELEFWSKDLKAKLDFIKQAGFEPEMPPSYRFPPTRFEIMEYREDYLDLAFGVNEYVKKYYTLAESIIVYLDIVNSIFNNKCISLNEDGVFTATMDNGIIIPMWRLSSGEKQILIMFYDILFKTAPGSLVIIDEPEISLHVSWQQQLGKFFRDLAKLRGLHIVIATHAPAIIHEDWDLATELKE